MKFDQDRQFYRTKIKPGDIALFCVGAFQMPIREISERGIRYEPAPGHAPAVDETVKGIVALKTIGNVEVSGRFMRVQDDTLVVVLDPPGITHASIKALQAFLMEYYSGRA